MTEYPHLQALIDGVNEVLEELYERTKYEADDSKRYSQSVASNYLRLMLKKEGLPEDLLVLKLINKYNLKRTMLKAKFHGKRSRAKAEVLVRELRGSMVSKKLGIL